MDPATPPRALRPSTTAQALFDTPPRAGRGVLSPSKTASLIRTPGHDCSALKIDNTRAKLDVRVWATFERFLWAAEGSCETFRGRTRYNGSVAHCEGRCHAAHAALTENLRDDKLERVGRVVAESGFAGLSPFSKKYLQRKAGLPPTPERKRLQDDKEDGEFLDVFLRQKRSSFSLLGQAKFPRSSTFENPRGANRVDCHVEHLLRRRENELALACTNKELTPEQAMMVFCSEYIEFLTTAVGNLRIRLADFQEFLRLEKIVLHPTEPPEGRYDKYIGEARAFIALKIKLSAKVMGAPNLKKKIQFFHEKSVYAVLQSFVDNFDQDPEGALDFYEITKIVLGVPRIKEDAAAIGSDLANRLLEAKTQLDKITEAQKDVPQLRKLYYGEVDAGGTRRTPKRERLQEQLLGQIEVNESGGCQDDEEELAPFALSPRRQFSVSGDLADLRDLSSGIK